MSGKAEMSMNREEMATFIASFKTLRDCIDDFNCQLAAIDGAGMRLGFQCRETAAACPCALAQNLNVMADGLNSFGGFTSSALANFLAAADVIARSARVLEIESRKGTH